MFRQIIIFCSNKCEKLLNLVLICGESELKFGVYMVYKKFPKCLLFVPFLYPWPFPLISLSSMRLHKHFALSHIAVQWFTPSGLQISMNSCRQPAKFIPSSREERYNVQISINWTLGWRLVQLISANLRQSQATRIKKTTTLLIVYDPALPHRVAGLMGNWDGYFIASAGHDARRPVYSQHEPHAADDDD